MLKTEEISLAIGYARFKNDRIYEYLVQMFSLVSATLPDFMQGQLDDFKRKKARICDMYAVEAKDPVMAFDVWRARETEILLAEVKFNQKLLRFNRIYSSYLNKTIERGQPLPECLASWIYQDYPGLLAQCKTDTLPATFVCEHIFQTHNIRNAEATARIVSETEQEAKRQAIVPSPTRQPYSSGCLPASEYHFEYKSCHDNSFGIKDKQCDNPVVNWVKSQSTGKSDQLKQSDMESSNLKMDNETAEMEFKKTEIPISASALAKLKELECTRRRIEEGLVVEDHVIDHVIESCDHLKSLPTFSQRYKSSPLAASITEKEGGISSECHVIKRRLVNTFVTDEKTRESECPMKKKVHLSDQSSSSDRNY